MGMRMTEGITHKVTSKCLLSKMSFALSEAVNSFFLLASISTGMVSAPT